MRNIEKFITTKINSKHFLKFIKILLIYLKKVDFKFERVHLLSLVYMSYRKSPTLVPSKLCLCLPTKWPLLPFRSEEHCRITDSLHITRFCELSSDLDLHRIQFLESHYTNDRSFAGRRGVWLCVCKTVAPPPHTMFFFPEGFRVREFFWAPQSVSQKLPLGIDPSWLQRRGVNWNSLPVSIRSAWIKSDVSTVISFYLDFTANRLNKPF